MCYLILKGNVMIVKLLHMMLLERLGSVQLSLKHTMPFSCVNSLVMP